MNQLSLNFNGYDAANENGVYTNCERMELIGKNKRQMAEIRIANAPFGFCWGVSATFSQGGFCWMPNECDEKHGEFSSTRIGAIKKAGESIIRQLSRSFGANKKEADAVIAWVDGCAE